MKLNLGNINWIGEISQAYQVIFLHVIPRGNGTCVRVCVNKKTYWKNLKAFTVAPELLNSPLRSSSPTEGLQRETDILTLYMLVAGRTGRDG